VNVGGVDQVFEYIRTAGSVGLLALATKFYVDLRRLKASSAAEGRAADLKLEAHRDGLTFDLLAAARAEVQALHSEVQRLRPADNHLQLFETALEHIEALLSADSAARNGVERSARAFLKRMRRMQEARGTISNEVQRVESGIHVAERQERTETPPAQK
jgi:septation ring formation regulator EzrA